MIKIGQLEINNPVFLAPMAGITNLNYRLLAREFGCALAFTEMVSSNGLVREAAKTNHYLDSTPLDRPLGVQIFGADPVVMAEAARIVEEKGCDLIDINMGCPVKKVVKTGAGSALMKTPELVKAIVSAVRKATVLPLTVKIRAGWRRGDICAAEIGGLIQDAGADAIIVHPRTADQGFSGHSDWGVIREVKTKLKIPIIGNGDIRVPEDALKLMAETGCDAVMVGRGSLGNPWIFRDIASLLEGKGKGEGPSRDDRQAMIRRHLDMEMAYCGDRPGLRSFRKHLLWYTKGLHGGASLRQILGQIQDRETLLKAVHDYFCCQIRP